MDRLMAQRTTLVIDHRLSTVRNANAIMVLENGEIIERGTMRICLYRRDAIMSCIRVCLS